MRSSTRNATSTTGTSAGRNTGGNTGRSAGRSIGKTIAAAAVAATTAATLSAIGAGPAHAAPARPDLTVTALTWTPGGVSAGTPVTFSATVKNVGKAASPAGVVHGVGFQVDGKLVTWSDTRTASLKPGQSATVTANFGPAKSATWAATQGKHEVLAYVDDAQRIAESGEGNNRTKTTLTVAAAPAMTTTLKGSSSYSTFAALPQRTGVSSTVRGSGYGACHTADGRVVAGTEKLLGEYSAGNSVYYTGGPYVYSGLADVPAGATSATSAPIDMTEIRRGRYGDPALKLTCAADQLPGFTRLHVTELTSKRWTLNEGGWSGETLLSTATAKVSADLPI
ncbi:hypothetical protein GTQ99_10300 [Kineococcus sp. T13]|uniref:CARDB domain-containing protein n=1 Tax=Kineococcus vitellinus TaxID=2696565 RepID=UPI0014124AAB|nr:CARDB domain-containing protein [Kineococcus vitellinus]NAZ75801.1 hypothetical protein [Kineococcus vitellinus]